MYDCRRAPGVSAIGGADQIYGKGAGSAGIIEIDGLHVCVGQIEALRLLGSTASHGLSIVWSKPLKRTTVIGSARYCGVIGYGH